MDKFDFQIQKDIFGTSASDAMLGTDPQAQGEGHTKAVFLRPADAVGVVS